MNRRKILLLAATAVLVAALYMTLGVNFSTSRFALYSLEIRLPRLLSMVVVAFAIGTASIVFQSIINNTLVTPCLLGMNSLYTLLHTAVIFLAGSRSLLATNKVVAFILDAALMGVTATIIYSHLFKRTGYNVLYVLLIGTLLTSLFSSIQNTLTRIMDPTEYDNLIVTLVASFNNGSGVVLAAASGLLAAIILLLRRDIAVLDVIALGRAQAMNLGVDYDRVIKRLLLGVVLAITVATALAGPLSFMGLIVANLARQLMGTYRHKYLLTASFLFAVILLAGSQLAIEQVFSYTVPVSVFITLAGGVYFLYLIMRQQKRS